MVQNVRERNENAGVTPVKIPDELLSCDNE